MKIFSLFNRPFLKPAWTFTAPGIIWRLFPAKSGELLGESRDQQKKQVSFFALNSATGLPLWQDLVLDEQWWIGIEEVSDGVLFLHKFSSPDMPAHRGIIAIDLATGKPLWSNEELTFWFAHQGAIFAHKMMFEKRIAFELDVRSGEVRRQIEEGSEPSLFEKREEVVGANQVGLEFPQMVDFDRIDQVISGIITRETGGGSKVAALEYLQSNKFLLMNYHVRSKESTGETLLLDNHLKVLDMESGRLLYTDTISRNSPAAVPDSFYVRTGMVYYVKEQKTLTAVKLLQ